MRARLQFSDPGEDLVALCAEHDVPVIPIPGCCAAICALAASGLPTGRWCFEGFLSVNKKARREHLDTLQGEKRTMIFYEAPHKLCATLRDLRDAFGGDRRLSLSRELTKLHEQTLRMTLDEAVAYFDANAPRGEFVLILEGAPDEPETEQDEAERLASAAEAVRRRMEQGQTQKDAVKAVSAETGVKKTRCTAMCSITKNNEKPCKANVFHFLALIFDASGSRCGSNVRVRALRMPFAQRNIAALDHQPFAVYKAIRQLAAGIVVDQLHRCAGHAHLRGSLLLLQIFQIHQTDGFIFIQRHLHALCRTFLRGKLAERRQTADSAALSRSRHELFVTVTAAAVAAAGMAFAVIMVRAVHIGIKRQRTVQERLHCLIGIALHTADQTDIGLRKRCLCAAANAAADQRIHTELCQQAGQRTVTAAVRIHHLCMQQLAAGYLVQLKLLRVAKMLENLSVFIGNCDFHNHFLRIHFWHMSITLLIVYHVFGICQ